ncbi:CHAP domain-containing protein [Allorhizocola rhizosphaerae]|uniref:CHAP domain-containing protein n=1 Tax=Allorhizocola rhizosphaerae TaxID=1872709 RepID=UPI000E3E2C1C|nr:CHAP domain-containing protein [Allorhizocola rhizosphaerae]
MGNHVFTRRGLLTLAAGTGAAVAIGVQRPAFAGSGTNVLRAGESLSANQYLRSSNGSYTAAMQGDGNFVLYTPSGAKWSTRTGGQNGSAISLQTDGNLVMYRNGTAIWHTGTAGYTGASLIMQDDGNLVMYRNGTAIWATSWHWTWGQTMSSNPNGQKDCSWYCYERFKRFSGVYPYVANGNAHTWNETAPTRGWLVHNSPATQSVVVFERGVAGASSTTGHVAWVDFMQQRSDGTYIHVWEMNFGGGLGVEHERWVKHQAGMSYLMAPQL